MSIFFWLAVAAYMTSMFSAPISKNYSRDATVSGELKEKICAIVAVGSMFLGHAFTIVTFILVDPQHSGNAVMLTPLALAAIMTLFL